MLEVAEHKHVYLILRSSGLCLKIETLPPADNEWYQLRLFYVKVKPQLLYHYDVYAVALLAATFGHFFSTTTIFAWIVLAPHQSH